jgi:hypothetical protein
MVICAVDYGQAHIFTSKLFRCLKAAKARAYYDDPRLFACGRLHLAISQQTSKFQPPNSEEALSFNIQIKSVEAVLLLMFEVSLELVAWDLVLLPAASNLLKQFVIHRDSD